MELEGKITFKSDLSVSFCTTIEFWDDHAIAVGFLRIYATADNCLLTTYMHSIKSFDDTAEHVEKCVSHSLISSDNGMDKNNLNEDISHLYKYVCFIFLFFPLATVTNLRSAD